jgi:septal ring factor EnvC (AmiA/AmiB activator)
MSEVTRDEFDKLQRQVEENTKRLAQGDTTLAVINTKLGQIDAKLDELTQDIRALKEKPAKRWESISAAVLQWVVTALLAYIAVKIGLA